MKVSSSLKIIAVCILVMLIAAAVFLSVLIPRSFTEGERLMKAKNYEGAIVAYERIIFFGKLLRDTSDPHVFPAAYFNIGCAYLFLKEYKDAKKNFEYAVGCFKKDITPNYVLEESMRCLAYIEKRTKDAALHIDEK